MVKSMGKGKDRRDSDRNARDYQRRNPLHDTRIWLQKYNNQINRSLEYKDDVTCNER